MTKRKSAKKNNGKRVSRYGKIKYVSYRNKKKNNDDWWGEGGAGL